ncbi:hypothetical protein [Pustulibacterium marinum]|nr:hypothetical protein [Pustulibacterium marinum]
MKSKDSSIQLGHRFPKLSNTQKIVGIVLGVFSAFALYEFGYMIREIIRVSSIDDAYNIFVLSDLQTWFYNFFLGAVAAIFGQSVTINYWLYKPKQSFQKKTVHRNAIVNDQRNLMSYFLSWFLRVAQFAFLAMVPAMSYYSEGLNTYYVLICVLIILVLFLQSWTSLRLVYKRESLRYMGISFAAIIGVALTFSFINFLDYQTLNKNVLAKNIMRAYEIQLPKSDAYEKVSSRTKNIPIYIVKDSIAADSTLFYFENTAMNKSQMIDEIQRLKSSLRTIPFEFYISFNIHVGEGVTMKEINKIREVVSYFGINWTGFAVAPNKDTHEQHANDKHTVYLRVPDKAAFYKFDSVHQYNPIIKITQTAQDKCLWNGEEVQLNTLKQQLYDMPTTNPNYFVYFYSNEDASYKNYIQIVLAAKEALQLQRDTLALKQFHRSYQNTTDTQKMELNYELPFRFMEVLPTWSK